MMRNTLLQYSTPPTQTRRILLRRLGSTCVVCGVDRRHLFMHDHPRFKGMSLETEWCNGRCVRRRRYGAEAGGWWWPIPRPLAHSAQRKQMGHSKLFPLIQPIHVITIPVNELLFSDYTRGSIVLYSALHNKRWQCCPLHPVAETPAAIHTLVRKGTTKLMIIRSPLTILRRGMREARLDAEPRFDPPYIL